MDELLQALGMNNLGRNTFGSPMTPAPPPMATPNTNWSTAQPPGPGPAMASAVPPPTPSGLQTVEQPGGAAQGPKPFDPNTFMKALQGVKAPTVPDAQKVASPHITPPAAIHGGNLLALLQSLGLPASSAGASGYHLPPTLSGGYNGTLGLR